MKRLFSILAIGFASIIGGAWVACAQQIELRTTLAYSTFIVGEPIVFQVDVRNLTHRAFEVNQPDDKTRLFFEVTKGGDYDELRSIKDAPMIAPFLLKTGQPYQFRAELDKWFALDDEGTYVMRAVLIYNGSRYESAKRTFDVVPGFEVKSGMQMFVNREKMTRTLKLVYWSRNEACRLFLRMTDEPSGRIWDTIDLGLFMRESEPKLDIAADGEVTVIHRSTQEAFIRTRVWSLVDAVEIVERNRLLDPEVSAAQRMRILYGESLNGEKEDAEAAKKKKSWWKLW